MIFEGVPHLDETKHFDYAITQLRWMQQTLIPLLAQLQVPSASLRVNGGAVWKDGSEIPALRRS